MTKRCEKSPSTALDIDLGWICRNEWMFFIRGNNLHCDMILIGDDNCLTFIAGEQKVLFILTQIKFRDNILNCCRILLHKNTKTTLRGNCSAIVVTKEVIGLLGDDRHPKV